MTSHFLDRAYSENVRFSALPVINELKQVLHAQPIKWTKRFIATPQPIRSLKFARIASCALGIPESDSLLDEPRVRDALELLAVVCVLFARCITIRIRSEAARSTG